MLRRYWAGAQGALLNVTVDGRTGVPHAAPLPHPAPARAQARGTRAARGARGGAHGARAPRGARGARAAHGRRPARRLAEAAAEEVLYYKKPTARGTALGTRGPDAWCADTPSVSCGCQYDGMHGEGCESRHEAFCLNQCSGHGRCDAFGGASPCDAYPYPYP